MNTDCKMYTNLVNRWLAPWAVSKLHNDQKSFVPGQLITDHTRLTYEVAHLADVTGTRGYIVSLDQAKVYDCVDQRWLICVLLGMGIDIDLCNMIKDIVTGCHSKVRINGSFSTWFSLHRGVRQGDPLSCLLFTFSIEPLAMRLCTSLHGFSVDGLPPVKTMLYADDINLFLSESDSIQAIIDCLNDMSYMISVKFNHDKTDIKPIGTAGFAQCCFDSQTLNGQKFPSTYILAPSAPLQVLSVWVRCSVCGSGPLTWLWTAGSSCMTT